MTSRTEDDIVDMISEALHFYEEEYNEDVDSDDSIITRTYSEVGMLTSNSGLVLRIGDDEFKITVVKR